MKSRTAIFEQTGKPFRLEDVEVPPLKRGEILVRNECTTLCRSDLNTWSGKRIEKTPTILGHEIVGRIEEAGPDAPTHDLRGKELKRGSRVTWAIYASDPESPLSRRGIPQKAEDLFKYGHERITDSSHLHGGLSEFCILRRNTPILRVDERVPVDQVALINCSVSTVAGAFRIAGEFSGKTVLVTGAGMLGVIAVAMARTKEAGRIIAHDLNPGRLEMARRFGADHVIGPQPEEGLGEALSFAGEGSPDLYLDFSGAPEAMEKSLEAMAIGGTAVFVGATFPQRDLAINAERVVRNLHGIKGLHNYNEEDFIEGVSFMERYHGQFPFAELIGKPFPLDQVNEAFLHAKDSGAYRVAIHFH